MLTQDEASSVVWGMPGFVVRAGLADKVLALTDIAAEITRRVTATTTSGWVASQPVIPRDSRRTEVV